jgi:signal peptidase I
VSLLGPTGVNSDGLLSLESPQRLLSGFAGKSMLPTLCAGDLLELRRYRGRSVTRGDVVWFIPPGCSEPVVHRVVKLTGNAAITRGDNAKIEDPWQLAVEAIAAQVVVAHRGAKRHRIHGGWRGAAISRCNRLMCRGAGVAQRMSGVIWRVLSRRWSGVVSRALALEPRVVIFESGGVVVKRLMLGQRPIGQCRNASGSYSIRWPYRLFVQGGKRP